MRDQLSNRRVQLSQISSAPGAQTAVVAKLRRGFERGRKPKDGSIGPAWNKTFLFLPTTHGYKGKPSSTNTPGQRFHKGEP
jgi:hypothetical protein